MAQKNSFNLVNLFSCTGGLCKGIIRTGITGTCKNAPVKMLRYELKENIVMKMISRRDFLKASAVVGATAAMTACGGSSSTSTAASSVASSTAASAAATNGSANIGVCIYQFADNFMTLYRSDLEEYLKDLHLPVCRAIPCTRYW